MYNFKCVNQDKNNVPIHYPHFSSMHWVLTTGPCSCPEDSTAFLALPSAGISAVRSPHCHRGYLFPILTWLAAHQPPPPETCLHQYSRSEFTVLPIAVLWAPCSPFCLNSFHIVLYLPVASLSHSPTWAHMRTHVHRHMHPLIYTGAWTRLCFSQRQWPFYMTFMFLLFHPSTWYMKGALTNFCWVNERIFSDTWKREEAKELWVFSGEFPQLRQGKGAVAMCSVNTGLGTPGGTAAPDLQWWVFNQSKPCHNPSTCIFLKEHEVLLQIRNKGL